MQKEVAIMKYYYCSNCEKEQASEIITKEETLNVKGQNITCKIRVRVCLHCREEIIDRDLDNESLLLFYNEYRKKNNLLLPSEIKRIRNKYLLSQSTFSKLLGFGEKTITRYENGAIQDLAHDNLIRLMDSIDAFETIWSSHKDNLTNKANKKIKDLLTSLKMQHNTEAIIISWSLKNNWGQASYKSNASNTYKYKENYICPTVS